ncbi:MATE family efflux transporter [Streptococcus moroccensis]|uniref:Probable multidrug resistance protein NorM n=1 Tax=Streptococcus moroccensis TaxID=1451356 RepID=A0ABT9YSU5_9STRE|nr:MATE family efflux transporter [Streptococcus moroccensis]MDQ0223061.1 putative MATE family efflux protein [Streptococcus moroccensis]
MHDLTKGKPIKVILLFTIPLVVGSIFQLFYNFADSMIVGHTLGEQSFAAVGATGSIVFFILGFAQGLTGGFSVILAQRYGAKDNTDIKRSFITGLTLSLAIGLVLSLIALTFLGNLLELMQTPPELIDQSKQFLTAIFGGSLATILYNYLSNSIRALGDSRTPLYALIVAVILNVILDFVFILNFKLGVFGAGVATIIAQVLSVLFLIWHIKKKVPLLQLSKNDWHLVTKEECQKHLQLGLPMGFQASIIAIGTMTLQYALNQLGTEAIAAQAIASRTDQLAMLPMINLGQAISTFTAQNYGAKAYRRIFDGVKKTVALSVIWSLLFVVILLLGNRFFSSLFLPNGSESIYQMAFSYYVINGVCYWILAILFVLRGFIQGLGKSFAPTLAGIMELIMRVVVALIGLHYFGFTGVAAANPAAWIGSVAILIPTTYIVTKQLKGFIANEKKS